MNIKTSLAREGHRKLIEQAHKTVFIANLIRDSEVARTLLRAHITKGRGRIY